MSFFNGEFNGNRVINLGTRGLSKSTLLRKAKEERQRRKTAKEQEKAAIVLQKNIRSYLDLQNRRYQFYDSWKKESSLDNDINLFVRQFCFINDSINKDTKVYFWSLKRLQQKLLLEINHVKAKNVEKLFNCLVSYPFTKNNNENTKCIVDIIALLAQQIVKLNLDLELDKGCFDSMIRLQFNDKNQIFCVLRVFSYLNPFVAFKILFSDGITLLCNSHEEKFAECIKICLSNFSSDHQKILDQLDNTTKVELFSNLVQITRRLNELENFDYFEKCLNSIIVFLASINFQICNSVTPIDTDESDDIEESNIEDVGMNGLVDKVVVTREQFEKLDYLYSKGFAKIFFSFIEEGKIPITYLTAFFGKLKKLRDGSVSEIYQLLVYLYVLPNGFSSFKRLVFVDEISDDLRDPLYKPNLENNNFLFLYIAGLSELKILSLNNKFLNYFIPNKNKDNTIDTTGYLNEKFFRYDIFLFMEIMVFWLMIVTDVEVKQLDLVDEISNRHFITMKEFKQFINFLKNLSILLIQNTSKISNSLSNLNDGSSNDQKNLFGSSNFNSESFGEGSNRMFGASNDVNSSNTFKNENQNSSSLFGTATSSSAFGDFNSNIFGNASHNEEKELPKTQNLENINKSYDSKLQTIDFVCLKKLCLKLLNMINLLDSRIKFLPKDFWIIHDSKYNSIQKLAEDLKKQELINETDKKADVVESDSIYTILNECPFFIPFHLRVEIFAHLKNLDKQAIANRNFNIGYGNFINLENQKVKGSIRRDHILDDSMKFFSKPSVDLRHQLLLTFIDQYGNEEAGVDGGGLTKEFLTSVCEEGFKNGSNDLFRININHQLYPNPDIYLSLKYLDKEIKLLGLKDEQMNKLKKLEFLGEIIGKCLFEGILVDVEFVPIFLKKLKSFGNISSFDELNDFDPELYNGLSQLLKLDNEFFDKSSDLTFSIIENVRIKLNTDIAEDNFEKSINVDLIKNGDQILVKNNNKMEFINCITNFKLNKCLDLQTKFFMTGILKLIPSYRFKMFNPSELQTLISGGTTNLDVDDFQKNVVYGGYTKNDITIRDFWEIVDEMTNDERCKLLKFVTSVPRAPLLGFSHLEPKFGIRNAFADQERIPTASTCFNLLKLPDYRNKEILKNKLMFAINADAGFDLS